MIDRRTLVICACGRLAGAFRGVGREAAADLGPWLARNVVPLRTIDPDDDDLSDLAPLAGAIRP